MVKPVQRIKTAFRVRYRRLDIKLNAKRRRASLTDQNFTIISNNCWGGFVYQSYGLRYQSPTIGLYFAADDYVEFLSKLKYYTSKKLEFIQPEESKRYCLMKNIVGYGKHPVGNLDGVEIYFLHYHSEEEAYEKWTARCERINWDSLLIKMNDQNFCTEHDIRRFDSLEYKNKIFFSSSRHQNVRSELVINSAKNQSEILSSQEPYGKTREIDITKLINSL